MSAGRNPRWRSHCIGTRSLVLDSRKRSLPTMDSGFFFPVGTGFCVAFALVGSVILLCLPTVVCIGPARTGQDTGRCILIERRWLLGHADLVGGHHATGVD